MCFSKKLKLESKMPIFEEYPKTNAIIKITFLGSGSSYIYGHCDATFKEGMTKDECYRFVANGR